MATCASVTHVGWSLGGRESPSGKGHREHLRGLAYLGQGFGLVLGALGSHE